MPQTPQAPPSPSDIICAALEPGLKGGIAANRTARLVSALHAAGWHFVHEDVIPATGQSPPTASAASSAVGPASVALLSPTHPDDVAVDAFAGAMKAKLARSRERGREGWNDAGRCSVESLAAMLNEHVLKGDPVDVANFAMMLHQRGGRTSTALTPATVQARAWEHCEAVCEGDPTDLEERRDRFTEEALELIQACGGTLDGVIALAGYVFGRAVENRRQEFGGTMTTLASLASMVGEDLLVCGEAELARTWEPDTFARIRRKRANRHGRGPLPGVDGDLVTSRPSADALKEA